MNRLVRSLDILKLPYHAQAIESLGDWAANARYTATHILNMMDAYPDRPIIQLNADAFIWQYPELFERGLDCDAAACRMPWGQLANGTIYLSPTASARALIREYAALVRANPKLADEQLMLDHAIRNLAGSLLFFSLPLEYCWIDDLHRKYQPTAKPIIEHLQASRERHPSEARQRRRARVDVIKRHLD